MESAEKKVGIQVAKHWVVVFHRVLMLVFDRFLVVFDRVLRVLRRQSSGF